MPQDQLQETYDGGALKLRLKRQIFVPSNVGTNTFVFDTVSFLSVLTLVVFLVRVFSRVIKSNNAQRITVAADPSLSRTFGDFEIKSDIFGVHMKSKEGSLESAMKSNKSKTRLKVKRRSNDRRSIDQVDAESINSVFSGDIGSPVISSDTIDNFESVLPFLDQNKFESQFRRPKSAAATWTQSAQLLAKEIISFIKQTEPLDRRKRGSETVNENERQFFQRPQRPLPPIVQQQGGIAGVDYDTIYLSIGVAATALFIIETLFKAYQLYTANNGRSLGSDTVVDRLIDSFSFETGLTESSLSFYESENG